MTGLRLQLLASKLPLPVVEYAFAAPQRRWRFDWAWPDQKLALECEGGVWTAGRHTRGAGFERDAIKYAEALIRGWRVLRFTPKQIADGTALRYLEPLLRVS